MIIVREILEDFLILRDSEDKFLDYLSNLGINVESQQNAADLFTNFRIDTIKYIIDGHYFNNDDIVLLSYDNNIKFDKYDQVIVDSDGYIIDFEELNFLLPIFEKINDKSILPLNLYDNISLNSAMNLSYTFYCSNNVWNLFDSYSSLAYKLHKTFDIPLLERSSLIYKNDIITKDGSFNYNQSFNYNNLLNEIYNMTDIINNNNNNKLFILSLNEDINIPQWLKIRLALQNVKVDNLAQAIKEYVCLEYSNYLDVHECNNSNIIIYSIRCDAKDININKIYMRIIELWQQHYKINYLLI